ncbi:MAG: ABC transporter ATP-binding protein [Pseudolabrys sp.]|nr:ABC transporter ATP-binding protein [Pseudolabrys sp.]
MTLLTISRLTKKFGGLTAVDNFDAQIEPGGVHGLIGPNGSGKSTILNLISGIYRPTSGAITMGGTDVTRLMPHERSRVGIGRTFQNIRLFPTLTVLQNVTLGRVALESGTLFGVLFDTKHVRAETEVSEQKAMEALRFMGIDAFANELPRNLPYGHQRLVEIARVLASDPKLMLLDEPAAGLNSSEKKDLGVILTRICDSFGATILLVEHDMRLLMSVSQTVSVVNFGRLVATGPSADVQANPEVKKAYLGEGALL